ncbi:MAG: hypothetical protein KBF82_03400 [Chitinophagaceae bacterium]|nr:hypothetical protein [Chitinophagaceae bacterium]
MNIKTIFIATLANLFSVSSFSQTIDDAKDFLKQQIESNPTSDKYTQFLVFANELSNDNASYFTKQKFDPSIYKQVCIQSETLNFKGESVTTKINAFDVKGIKNIIVTTQDLYTQITIYLKDGFPNVFNEISDVNKTTETNYLNKAIFYIKHNNSLGERVAKSLFFLSKQYGGTPTETSPF